MQKFTLQVANGLTEQISKLKDHLKGMVTQEEGMAIRDTGRNGKQSWLQTHAANVHGGSYITFISDYLPMQQETLMACYIDRVKKEIQEREYSFQQLNDDSAPTVNTKYGLITGLVKEED